MNTTDKNEVERLVADALQKWRRAEALLRAARIEIAADEVGSLVVRGETIAQTYLKDLAGVDLGQKARNPLSFTLISIWSEAYPDYGEPSVEDKQAVRRLFIEVIERVYPQAGGPFFRHVLGHYQNSTAGWVVRTRPSLKIFAKHFRSFVNEPLADDRETPVARTAVRSDGFDARR